jgi:hypothetical protein
MRYDVCRPAQYPRGARDPCGGKVVTQIEYLDRPPAGEWFPVSIARKKERGWEWEALLTDVDPDELKNCTCESPLWLFVHPDEYRPQEGRVARARCVRIPGKHRNRDAAWAAFCDLLKTRH